MPDSIKLIAVDVDGTLLTDDHQLTLRTESALKTAIHHGIPVVIATGKTRYSTRDVVKQLGLTTPGVYVQGLIIAYPDGRVGHQLSLPDDIARKGVELALELKTTLLAYRDMDLFTNVLNADTKYLPNFGEKLPLDLGHDVNQFMAQKPLQKMIYIDAPWQIDEWRPLFEETFAETADLVRSRPNMLELMPRHASKGAGLKKLLDEMHVAPEDIIAFGDAENDIEMLQMAGIGVAMGNAMPVVKEIADTITLTNNESGVGIAVEQYVLAPRGISVSK